jgi:very-short-patch-repair endonuclease
MSPPEVALWSVLRQRPGGFQFRRQRPADPYKLDFFCRPPGLAIEVDGDSHDMGDNPVRGERDQALRANGVKTMRFPAREVMKNLEGVVAAILDECAARAPPPRFARSHSPRNRGED